MRARIRQEGNRYIISAPGFRQPNYVDFAGPLGLQQAYNYEQVTIRSLKRAAARERDQERGRKWTFSGYCSYELESHRAILDAIKSVADHFNVELSDEHKTMSLNEVRRAVTHSPYWGEKPQWYSRFAAGSWSMRRNDLPSIEDKPIYTLGAVDLPAILREEVGRAQSKHDPKTWIVIANVRGLHPWVTWIWSERDGYYWGHYHRDEQDAWDDFRERMAKGY